MGKDKHGRFIPPKGKPSGNGKEDLGVSSSLSPEAVDKNLEITDKYTNDSEAVAPGVHVLHPNRNVHKETAAPAYDADNTTPDKTTNDTFRGEQFQTPIQELPYPLTRDDFAELAGFRSDCCVSVYLPTHQAGMEINEQEDRVRFKTLLQEAHLQLKERDMQETAIGEILQPGFDLVRNEDFWHTQLTTLVVFFTKEGTRYLRLPLEVDEKLYIDDHFWLLPLAPLLNNVNNDFYLLSFSKHHAQLFRGNEFEMHPVEVPGMPYGIEDVVHFEKGREQLFRTGSSGAGGGANYHGMNANADHKTNIAQYLDEVDDTLWKEVLSTENKPLMLAAVDYLIPIYKSISRYQHITEEGLTGNFQHYSDTKLYGLAKEKMQPYFNRQFKQVLAAYGDRSASALSASIPADIVPAAYYGQVAHLVVQKDGQLWGRFDPQANKLELHDTAQAGDECLMNEVVIQTVLHNGDVWLTDKAQLPEGTAMIAVLRYP